jgi:peptidyl-tRNA hydrolase, PTH1 family
MWAVVGLGNPGAEYARSRHNVGFMVVKMLAERWRVPLKDGATLRYGHGSVSGRSTLLVQPQTFMNRSGEVILALGLSPDDIMVIVYDDLDLPVGQLRIRPRGGSGGHRGVASIVERCGGEFVRVRVGIGRPPADIDPAEHVLAPLSEPEWSTLRDSAARASDAVECILAEGPAAAMNRFNVRPNPEER